MQNNTIISPPGTYLPPGTTTILADPGGAYSGAGATAYTADPAGTYSSPYALNRLFIGWSQRVPATAVLAFTSITAVENYFGVGTQEADEAKEFFAGYTGTGTATMYFTRIGLGQRPHLLGANISGDTLSQLQSINGSIAMTFNGYNYSGNVSFANVTAAGFEGFVAAAADLETALNAQRPTEAVTTGDTITPETVNFTGYIEGPKLYVTSVQSGALVPGGIINGAGVTVGANSQLIRQGSGATGGAGDYYTFAGAGDVTKPEPMTETYGLLTVGSVTSGTVAVGQQVTGTNVLNRTAIDANLSGSGAGSTWVVDYTQTAAGNFNDKATPLTVSVNGNGKQIVGATEDNDYFDVDPNSLFGFDENPSAMSYMTGAAADALGLSQGEAVLSSPGGVHESVAQFMNGVLNETDQYGNPVHFGSFQSNEPRLNGALASWADGQGLGYEFWAQNFSTPPAGSSLPVTDPAGAWSGPGASAPTRALRPTITGARANQSDPSGQPDTPFAKVTITDPNVGATDSLSIQLSGLGGTLADGVGFTGLTENQAGVYLLSGTAEAITAELDAVIYTPATGSGTTTFSLIDTSLAGTSASNDKTTVNVGAAMAALLHPETHASFSSGGHGPGSI